MVSSVNGAAVPAEYDTQLTEASSCGRSRVRDGRIVAFDILGSLHITAPRQRRWVVDVAESEPAAVPCWSVRGIRIAPAHRRT